MKQQTTPEPYLYILMRTDLDSMNPGKGMAQACHAANCAVSQLNDLRESKPSDLRDHEKELIELFDIWENSTNQSFGTTIVLDGGTIAGIKNTIMCINSMHDKPAVLADVIYDPTYPLIDGSTLHLLPLETCAFVFCDKHSSTRIKILLDQFNLHP